MKRLLLLLIVCLSVSAQSQRSPIELRAMSLQGQVVTCQAESELAKLGYEQKLAEKDKIIADLKAKESQ